MPIYEYLCEKCEHEFEREQRITEDPVKTCPECRSRKVKRLISQTSFVLKGGGWYNDLYSSSDGKSSDASDGDSGTAQADSSDTSKDSKSADKSESKSSKSDKGKGKGKGKGSKGKSKSAAA